MEEEKLTRSLSPSYPNDRTRWNDRCRSVYGCLLNHTLDSTSVMGAYAIAGFFLYLIMRALGEMLYVDPSTGSFANYASEYIHPVAGYLTAWSNIFQYIVVGISEVIAVGSYMNYWWPDLPAIIPGSLSSCFLCWQILFLSRRLAN